MIELSQKVYDELKLAGKVEVCERIGTFSICDGRYYFELTLIKPKPSIMDVTREMVQQQS